MNNLKELIKESVASAMIETTTPFREIKHFHPSGKSMPNGCHYQRGGFLN